MASWCPICAKNREALNEVYPKYEDQVNFVAISIDPSDTQPVLQDLAEDKEFVFNTVPGNPEIVKQFGVEGQTEKFGITADGEIVYHHKELIRQKSGTNCSEA